jgi:hypothetical protein
MAPEDIRSLSVSALKEILHHNHVSYRLLIEKSDLVEKVITLVDDERRERERQQLIRLVEEQQERFGHVEMESETHRERLDELHLGSEHQTPDVAPEQTTEIGLGQGPEVAGFNGAGQHIPTANVNDSEQQTTADTTTIPNPMSGLNVRPSMAINLERNGLCVICQDEEANIAIVDCG